MWSCWIYAKFPQNLVPAPVWGNFVFSGRIHTDLTIPHLFPDIFQTLQNERKSVLSYRLQEGSMMQCQIKTKKIFEKKKKQYFQEIYPKF